MTTEPRDSHELDEDGFHEIQLSGKQLVFLCMATTVVSIVIFLCGVLVGRGVRPVEPVAEAATVASTEPVPPAPEPASAPAAPASASNAPAASANKPSAADSMPQPPPDAPPKDERGTAAAAARPNAIAAPNRSVISPSASSAPAASATPASAKPAEPAPKRPEGAKPESTTAAARPAPAPPPPVADAPAKPASEPTTPAASPASSAPAASASSAAGNGAIAVQVGAMKEKGDAEALARHLSGKGYAVYIVQPAGNAPNPVYRVRVGNYTSQDEAARVKRRLEQEEKLKPWITR